MAGTCGSSPCSSPSQLREGQGQVILTAVVIVETTDSRQHIVVRVHIIGHRVCLSSTQVIEYGRAIVLGIETIAIGSTGFALTDNHFLSNQQFDIMLLVELLAPLEAVGVAQLAGTCIYGVGITHLRTGVSRYTRARPIGSRTIVTVGQHATRFVTDFRTNGEVLEELILYIRLQVVLILTFPIFLCRLKNRHNKREQCNTTV